MISENFRKKRGFPQKVDGFYENEFRTPFVYAWLLSLLPKKYAEKIVNYTGLLAEALNLLLLAGFLHYLNISYSLGLLLLFVFYPSFTSLYPGPRTYQGTPRVYVELFANIYFVLLFAHVQSSNIGFLLLSVFFGSLVLLTGKFGVQVILPFSILVSIFTSSLIVAVTPLLCIVFANIISHGVYRKIFTHHLTQLRHFARELQYVFDLIQKRYDGVVERYKEEGLQGIAKKLLFDSDFYNLLVKNYLFLPVLVYSISSGGHPYLVGWMISSGLMFLLTSYKHLRFLGESERYLFFSTIPLFVIFAQLNLPSITIYLLLIGQIAYFSLMLLALYFKRDHSETIEVMKKLNRVCPYLRELETQGVLPIIDYNAWEIRYKTQKPMSLPLHVSKDHEKYFNDRNLPITDLDTFQEKFPFEHILIEKKHQDKYDLSPYEKVFETEGFLVYQANG